MVINEANVAPAESSYMPTQTAPVVQTTSTSTTSPYPALAPTPATTTVKEYPLVINRYQLLGFWAVVQVDWPFLVDGSV